LSKQKYADSVGWGQTAESYVSVLLVDDLTLCLKYSDKLKLYMHSV